MKYIPVGKLKKEAMETIKGGGAFLQLFYKGVDKRGKQAQGS